MGTDDPEDDVQDDPAAHGEDAGSRARVLRFARRLLDRRDLAEDTKDLVSAVLLGSDKAKNEAVRLVAREVRSYLKELKLREELAKLVREHSLEVSIRLKPLASDPKDGDGG